MLVLSSLDSVAYAPACLARSAVAVATAALASARSVWALLRSALFCTNAAAVSLMLAANASLALLPDAIDPDKLP